MPEHGRGTYLARSLHVSRRALVLAAATALVGACGDQGSLEPDAGAPDAGPTGQGSAATGALAINEVAPRPDDGPDWVEIVNRSDEAVDLCDYLVTDSLDRLDHYHPLGGAAPPDLCEPRMLAPGAYLVVYADDAAEPSLDHAGFQLARADQVHVATWTGDVVDLLLYLHLADDGAALARRPDGEGLFYPTASTAGAANPELP